MGNALFDLPLEDLLPHLAERRATGTLNVETRRSRKKVYLLDGLLAGLSSSNPPELIGHFLVGWGLISEEQLSEATQLQEKLGSPLGRILVRLGALDDDSLDRALQAQAEEALLELFLVPIVEQRFLENVVPADHPLSLRLPVPELVLEGLRRRQRAAELLRVLGGFDAVPRRTEATHPDDLSGRELHILAEIDGSRDLEAVGLASHIDTFHVAELAARGVSDGFLAVSRARSSDALLAPDELLNRAEEALAESDLRACWSMIERLRTVDTDNATRRRITVLERGVAEALAQRRIAGNLVPRILGLEPRKASESLSPAEAFVLSRINDRWSLREIQRITPVGELSFGVIVDTLVRSRLIELRHPKGGPALA